MLKIKFKLKDNFSNPEIKFHVWRDSGDFVVRGEGRAEEKETGWKMKREVYVEE